MSAYANDLRVRQHPDDGTWMVFASDAYTTEYNVLQAGNGLWYGFDADGGVLERASAMATRDDAIRALIGPPR